MLFSIVCVDKPDSVQLRMDTRPAHVEHLKAHAERLLLAGPNLAADGQTPIGSILVYQADSEAEARAFAEADPYAEAGLFESVTVKGFRKVLVKPELE